LALALSSCGQSAGKINNEGNEAFREQDYGRALAAYEQAKEGAPELAEPYYNAANAHYRQEAYDLARAQVEQALVAGEGHDALDPFSFYNLGNNLFRMEQYEGAIESYIEALRLNPDDLEAKQNLELTMRQLQQQQNEQEQQRDQPQDQGQQDEEQNQQSGEETRGEEQQEGRQDQQPGDESQSDEQKNGSGEQQGRDQDSQPGTEPQDSQAQDGEQEQQHGEEPQQDGQSGGEAGAIAGLSEEQARQLLAAASEGTKSLEQFLQQILVSPFAPPSEDW
jgi:Ca-activated chloride channel family protein